MLPPTKREGLRASPEPPRFEPVAGAVVAEKYRIERVLGEGGMGIVVAAVHLGLEQPVAIKFLLPEAMRNQVAVERFQREARVAAMIRSEHVARVHDVGTLDGGVPYIVMEQLVGSDLGQTIAKGGALPLDEACEIALQACEALGEVHAAGIVHRDLKPSNLFVTRRADGAPAVKLLDFGISKLTLSGEEPTIDPALTATATIMGSPSYMSPEQLKSTKEVDSRTDVWSLGAVLYEAVTGKPAFRGETVPQVCAMIASEPPRPPSSLRAGIPAELERAILECLEKDAGKRISLVDLAHVLARFAPERAKPSLRRLEAVLGASARTGLTSGDRPPSRDELPVLPLATAERNRTVSAWGRREPRGRGAGGGALMVLALGIIGVLGVGIATGRFSVRRLRGDIAGATSLVSSAATAVSSAVSSAVASSLPPLPVPTALPGVDPTAEEGDEGDEVEDAEAPAVSPPDAARTVNAASTPTHSTPTKHPSKNKRPSKSHRRHG
ncbi:MAG TPA: serine/threonine-protein kinase [Polyangiaceae bacterium]|nr:serine/threonine-protein kinase [Polyangiaceae bacterium]